jgi:hypothetical protein
LHIAAVASGFAKDFRTLGGTYSYDLNPDAIHFFLQSFSLKEKKLKEITNIKIKREFKFEVQRLT